MEQLSETTNTRIKNSRIKKSTNQTKETNHKTKNEMQFTSHTQESGLERAQVNRNLFKRKRTKKINQGAASQAETKAADKCIVGFQQ